jgi:iron complex transport system substrate-binding protein
MTPRRIASLLAGSTEILYGLGLGDHVVAVSHECDYPEEARLKPRLTFTNIDAAASSAEIDRAVRTESAAGAPLYRIDAERLAELRPDLIVTQAQCDVCAVSLDDVRAAVESVPGLASAAVVALNPNTLDGIFDDIARVGRAAGVPDRAERYIASLRARVDNIRLRAADIARVDPWRVVCLEWTEPIMVAANWMPELIRIAGGRCDITDAGAKTVYTDWNDVVEFDPQVVIVAPCGFELSRSVAELGNLKRLLEWDQIDAVQHHRLYAADGNAYFNRSGPRIVDSLELLAGLIHADRFSDLAERYAHAWRKLA